MRRFYSCVAQLLFLLVTQLVWGQSGYPGITVGENLHLQSSGTVTAGYSSDFGDVTSSAHNINLGVSGSVDGFYYHPNFISFNVTPYYNQSKSDSASQSLSNSSGVSGTANLFTGTHFPGTISYRTDFNSTTSSNVIGEPNFTSKGNGQGYSIGWGATVPHWPTLAVGYSHGRGTSNVYGTSTESQTSNNTLNLHSSYILASFPINAYYTHTDYNSDFPEILTTQVMNTSNSSGYNYGFDTNHKLPIHGTGYFNYSSSNFSSQFGTKGNIDNTSYSTSSESAGAFFVPTKEFSFSLNEHYVSDLSGAIAQTYAGSGVIPAVDLGRGSHSLTLNGALSYEIAKNVLSSVQITNIQQHFFGSDYSSTYASGTLTYAKRIFDMFTVSATMLDSQSNLSSNSLGFGVNLGYFHKFGRWSTSGNFSYFQNAQTMLVIYTQSSYNYNARFSRYLTRRLQWISGINGTHSGLSAQPGSSNHSENYNTSLSTSRYMVNASYSRSTGQSLLSGSGLVPVQPTPGIPTSELTVYSGNGINVGASASPIRNLTIAGSYSRSLNNTLSSGVASRNRSEQLYGQVQYHLRRLNLLAGYTRLTQGISAAGTAPTSETSYFVGVSRWFKFF
jgi:hypothetical protein